MVGRFIDSLFGNVPAQFSSAYPMTESLGRLQAATKRNIFSALFRRAAVGKVTESKVRLQWVRPAFSNSFKPIFVGAFTQRHGRVTLEGRFTMFLPSKIFMTIWLGLVVVGTVLAVIIAARDVGTVGLPFALIGVLFFMAGVGFVRLSWWLSRDDMTYLADVIDGALRSRAKE